MRDLLLQPAWEDSDLQRRLVHKDGLGQVGMPKELKVAPDDAGAQRCANQYHILQQRFNASCSVLRLM